MLAACGAGDESLPLAEAEPAPTKQVATPVECNTLDAPTRLVARRAASGRAPDPTGGVLSDGTWELVDRVVHGSSAGNTNRMALTWVVRGNLLESVSVTDNDDRPIRGTARVTADADTLTVDGACGYGDPADYGYDATDNELRLHRVLAAGIVEITVYAKRH